MSINCKLFSVLALATLLSASLTANASITIANLISGQQNNLEDDDFEMLVNAGGTVANPGTDTILGVGDFLAAILRITAVQSPVGGSNIAEAGATEATITALVLAKVASVTAFAGGVQDSLADVLYTFTAPTLAEWASVFAPVAGAPIATTAGTIAVVFADPDNIDQSLGINSFASVNGTELWEVGFTGSSPNEYWTAQTDTDDVTTAFGLISGLFNASLSVTEQGAGPLLAPQLPSGGGQMLLVGGSLSGIPNNDILPFGVISDVDIRITPIVPEPATLATWFGLVVAAGMGAGRKLIQG